MRRFLEAAGADRRGDLAPTGAQPGGITSGWGTGPGGRVSKPGDLLSDAVFRRDLRVGAWLTPLGTWLLWRTKRRVFSQGSASLGIPSNGASALPASIRLEPLLRFRRVNGEPR